MASILPTSLAFALETTVATPPADAAAWITAVGSLTTGGRLRIIGETLDLSSFKQAMIDDMRSQEVVLGDEPMVYGIKGGVEFSFEAYLCGHGLDTSASSQVAQTAMGLFLLTCLGGQDRSNSTVLSGGGHSATVINVASHANIVAGSHIKVEDTDDSGRSWPRRVLDNTAGALTLDEALPFTPADNDLVHGAHTFYPAEAALIDSNSSGRTLSFLLSKGESGSNREHYVARGCKPILESIELSRNGLPRLKFRVLVGSFISPEAAPEPTWVSDPEGGAPLAIGPDTKVRYNNTGSTTSTMIHVAEFAFSTGIESVPHDTLTEADSGMPGRASYGLTVGKSTVDFTVFPYAQQHHTDFNSAQQKQLRFARVGTEQRAWALTIPRLEIVETPAIAPLGPSMAVKLNGRCLRNTTIDSTDNELTRARFCLVL